MKRFVTAGLLSLGLTVFGLSGAAAAEEPAETFEFTGFTADVCFGNAVKLTVKGSEDVDTTERDNGKVVEEGTFEGTFSWIVLDEETGEPDEDNELNAEGEFSGSFTDVFENDETNDDGEFIAPVKSTTDFEVRGSTDSGLEFRYDEHLRERIGRGGFEEGELKRLFLESDCTAK